MKVFISAVVGLLLIVVGAGILPGNVSAQMVRDAFGDMYACMPTSVAEVLFAHGAFSETGNIVVLCIEGYTPVFRDLP